MHEVGRIEAQISDYRFVVPRTLWTAFIISTFLICVYALTYNGKFRVDDEHILASRAQSFALRGRFEEPQVFGNQRVQGLQAFGDQATQIEPFLSLAGSLFYRAGLFLGLGGAQTYLLQNIYVTALTSGLIYLISRRLSRGHPASMFGALLFGLTSIAWPYALAFFRDTLAMFFATLAFLGFVMRFSTVRRSHYIGSVFIIFGCTGGIFSKNSVVVLIPAILLGVLLSSSTETSKRSLLKTLAIILAPIAVIFIVMTQIPPTGPLARFSLDYYGFLLSHFISSINIQTLWAFLGPFFSPAKSVILFNPALILLLPGMKSLNSRERQIRWVSITFILLLSLAQALFYRELWAGTFGWGLRYLLPALPGLFILVAGGIERLLDLPKGRTILAGVFSIGVIIQLSAVLVPWAAPLLKWQHQGLNPYGAQPSWSPRFLAIPYHIGQMVISKPEQIAWVRTLAADAWAWLIPGIALLFASGVFLAGYRFIKGSKRRSPNSLVTLMLVFIWVTPVLPNLLILERDPYWMGNQSEPRRLIHFVSASSQPGDVVLLDSYGTPFWNVFMNRWDRPVPYYALPFELPVSVSTDFSDIPRISIETEQLLTELASTKERVWYVASSAAPDYLYSGEVAWLENHAALQDVLTATGEYTLEVRLYTLP